MLTTAFLDLQHRDGASGRPCGHRLISEQRSAHAIRGAGDGYPGANLVPTGPGFGFELLFGIAEKTLDAPIEERVEKAPVKIASDLSGLRHRRPIREAAGTEQRNSFRQTIRRAPECNAERVAAVERRGHARKTID